MRSFRLFKNEMNEQNKQQKEEEKLPIQLLWEEAKRAWRSKKARAVFILFVFLMLIGGVVPAGKLPFLRSLVYAMGYSPDEAQGLTLLKALLSWNEHARQVRPQAAEGDDGIASPFGSNGNLAAELARLQQRVEDSRLINLRALNAALAAKGLPQDLLEKALFQTDTEDPSSSPAVYVDSNASVATQANSTQVAEVYFGADASAVARDPKDAFNSVNALKKIRNPHIAGARTTDWLERTIDKAVTADSQLAGIVKELQDKGGLLQFADMKIDHESKARRDLYYAWLTSLASRRTTSVPLKKTLAAAGFHGIEMPQQIFDDSGAVGIGLTSGEMTGELENIKLRIKNEELCKSTMNSAGETLVNTMNAARGGIDSLSGSFPKNCGEVGASSFPARLSNLRNQCQTIRTAYKDMGTFCGVAVKTGREGTCTTNNLENRYNAYASYCEAETQRCRALPPEAQAACLGELRSAADYDGGDCHGGGCSQNGVEKLVGDTFNVGVNGKEPNPYAGDFFPEADWQHSDYY